MPDKAQAFLTALALAAVLAAGSNAGAGVQASAASVPGSASVVKVVTRDASGNAVGSGMGVFLEIGRLLLPRALLVDRAYSAGVVYAGKEQRVTAVLADDPRAGLVLVAVDLPDGAPPAIDTRSSAAPAGRYLALAAEGTATPVELSDERDVPGIGTVRALAPSSQQPSQAGAAVVDTNGAMVGVLMERAAAGVRLVFVLPTSRVLRLPPVAASTVAEWLRRPQMARSGEAEAAFLRGAAAMLQDRPAEAAQSFAQARNAGAGDADVHAALAASELAAGHRDAAVGALRAAIAANPNEPRFHHDLALALGDAGRWDEAATEFSEVARLRPLDADAHFNLGSAYGQLGRFEDEYAAYQEALRDNSAHVKALRNLGIVCIALKRYAEAVAVSARAIRLLPSDAQLHAQLGVAYYDSGNHLTAIEELKKAIELDPGFSKAHYGLAIVYAAAGQREAALQECETLKRLDPARGAELMKLVSRK